MPDIMSKALNAAQKHWPASAKYFAIKGNKIVYTPTGSRELGVINSEDLGWVLINTGGDRDEIVAFL